MHLILTFVLSLHRPIPQCPGPQQQVNPHRASSGIQGPLGLCQDCSFYQEGQFMCSRPSSCVTSLRAFPFRHTEVVYLSGYRRGHINQMFPYHITRVISLPAWTLGAYHPQGPLH